jgi:hypothetical protein
VAGKTLRFRRSVIATGTRAHRPPIPGLAEAGFLTNETVFGLKKVGDAYNRTRLTPMLSLTIYSTISYE